MSEEKMYWYDPYTGYIVPDQQRQERAAGTSPLATPAIIQRALEYEHLTAPEIFIRLKASLNETIPLIGKDTFQDIMQGLRPCKRKSI